MKTLRYNERGSSHLVIVLAVVVLAGVGLVGYRVMTSGNQATKKTASPAAATIQTAAPGKISSKADVQQATKALDETPVDNSLDPKQLDGDLSDLF